jgi:hypothetical protein
MGYNLPKGGVIEAGNQKPPHFRRRAKLKRDFQRRNAHQTILVIGVRGPITRPLKNALPCLGIEHSQKRSYLENIPGPNSLIHVKSGLKLPETQPFMHNFPITATDAFNSAEKYLYLSRIIKTKDLTPA